MKKLILTLSIPLLSPAVLAMNASDWVAGECEDKKSLEFLSKHLDSFSMDGIVEFVCVSLKQDSELIDENLFDYFSTLPHEKLVQWNNYLLELVNELDNHFTVERYETISEIASYLPADIVDRSIIRKLIYHNSK